MLAGAAQLHSAKTRIPGARASSWCTLAIFRSRISQRASATTPESADKPPPLRTTGFVDAMPRPAPTAHPHCYLRQRGASEYGREFWAAATCVESKLYRPRYRLRLTRCAPRHIRARIDRIALQRLAAQAQVVAHRPEAKAHALTAHSTIGNRRRVRALLQCAA